MCRRKEYPGNIVSLVNRDYPTELEAIATGTCRGTLSLPEVLKNGWQRFRCMRIVIVHQDYVATVEAGIAECGDDRCTLGGKRVPAVH